jgi:hypothetical protein
MPKHLCQRYGHTLQKKRDSKLLVRQTLNAKCNSGARLPAALCNQQLDIRSRTTPVLQNVMPLVKHAFGLDLIC